MNKGELSMKNTTHIGTATLDGKQVRENLGLKHLPKTTLTYTKRKIIVVVEPLFPSEIGATATGYRNTIWSLYKVDMYQKG